MNICKLLYHICIKSVYYIIYMLAYIYCVKIVFYSLVNLNDKIMFMLSILQLCKFFVTNLFICLTYVSIFLYMSLLFVYMLSYYYIC